MMVEQPWCLVETTARRGQVADVVLTPCSQSTVTDDEAASLLHQPHHTHRDHMQSQLGLPRVLEYSSTTQVVNYSSNFLLLEYSLISISGCKFPFPVVVFAVN